jgi:hypothetical protein
LSAIFPAMQEYAGNSVIYLQFAMQTSLGALSVDPGRGEEADTNYKLFSLSVHMSTILQYIWCAPHILFEANMKLISCLIWAILVDKGNCE